MGANRIKTHFLGIQAMLSLKDRSMNPIASFLFLMIGSDRRGCHCHLESRRSR